MQLVLEAISDPTRRKILDLLKTGEKSAGQLGEHFNISGPSMSHHLSKLKAAELVITNRQGQSIYYAINTSVFEDAAKFLFDFFLNEDAKTEKPTKGQTRGHTREQSRAEVNK